MSNASIDWCADAGAFMPEGHCKGARRYRRNGSDLVAAFIGATPNCSRRVVVQAGGHVGQVPQQLAGYYAQVLTFEPDGANFRALAGNATRDNVYAFRAALGDSNDFGEVGVKNNARNSGGHHVQPAGDKPAEAVPLIALDSFDLYALDAVLLDAEGAELLAIEGAARQIETHRPVLLIEERGHIEGKVGNGSTAELYARLDSLGYEAGDMIGHDRLWFPKC